MPSGKNLQYENRTGPGGHHWLAGRVARERGQPGVGLERLADGGAAYAAATVLADHITRVSVWSVSACACACARAGRAPRLGNMHVVDHAWAFEENATGSQISHVIDMT